MKNGFGLIALFLGACLIFLVVGFVLTLYDIAVFNVLSFSVCGVFAVLTVVSIILGYKKIKNKKP